MKHWWQRVVKDYFTFPAKERKGLLILLAFSASAYLAAKFYPVHHDAIKPESFQKELASLKITIDSTSHQYNSYQKRNDDEESSDYERSNRYEHWKKEPATKGELFAFDPNTLDEAGWQRLGVRDKTIGTIQKFMAKGFRFKKPEDLEKIYGLQKEQIEKLKPYVRIESSKGEESKAVATTSNPLPAKVSEPYKITTLNINTADTSAFIALPGIGSKLANRIIGYREKLGGFTSVNQVGETYGLQDSVFQKLKPRFICTNTQLRQININTADAAGLKMHPYIKWNMANAIFNYRTQHGTFKSVDDLKKIDLITDDVFQKLKPYLTL